MTVAKPAVWTLAFKRKPEAKARRRISPMSDRRREKLREYKKVRDEFLRLKPKCEWPGCTRATRDCHHYRGRIGNLLTDKTWFKAVCGHHHDYIHEHPNEARAAGMLCERGQWNRS